MPHRTLDCLQLVCVAAGNVETPQHSRKGSLWNGAVTTGDLHNLLVHEVFTILTQRSQTKKSGNPRDISGILNA